VQALLVKEMLVVLVMAIQTRLVVVALGQLAQMEPPQVTVG
jgi:hypothetical protein